MKNLSKLSLHQQALVLDAYLEEKPFPSELSGYDSRELLEELGLALEDKEDSPLAEVFDLYEKKPASFRKLLIEARFVPPLRYSSRRGDWDLLPESLKDSMLYAYLFDGMTLRELDEAFLLEDPLKTKGFLSVRILHYMGVTGDFRGIYRDLKLSEGIASLNYQGEDYRHLVEALSRYGYSLYRQEKYSENDNLNSVVRDGGRYLYYSTKYERSSILRREAIDYHGKACMACGFDFEGFYGDLGRDFIEVHHTLGYQDPAQDLIVDVRTDMVCLCSNCHRMVHRKPGEVLSLEALREILEASRRD